MRRCNVVIALFLLCACTAEAARGTAGTPFRRRLRGEDSGQRSEGCPCGYLVKELGMCKLCRGGGDSGSHFGDFVTKRYDSPGRYGYPVSACLHDTGRIDDPACGQAAADSFCRQVGYSYAQRVDPDNFFYKIPVGTYAIYLEGGMCYADPAVRWCPALTGVTCISTM